MRRKIIGYEKTLEYLKEGNSITVSPMGTYTYIRIKDSWDIVTVRHDVFTKLLINKLIYSTSEKGSWNTLYWLKKEVQ